MTGKSIQRSAMVYSMFLCTIVGAVLGFFLGNVAISGGIGLAVGTAIGMAFETPNKQGS